MAGAGCAGCAGCASCFMFVLGLAMLTGTAGVGLRCVQYTWLGPSYSTASFNASQTNATANMSLADVRCRDLKHDKPVPCKEPILLTAPGAGVPDYKDVIAAFGEKVECDPGDADVCAVSTFYFNNEVVNVTRYCTRISVEPGHTPMTSGCESANLGTYSNTVCACTPRNTPCTAGSITGSLSVSLLLLSLLQLRRTLL